MKKILQKLGTKVLVQSRAAIQPFISVLLVRNKGSWVELPGIEPG